MLGNLEARLQTVQPRKLLSDYPVLFNTYDVFLTHVHNDFTRTVEDTLSIC
jgi:hypothetical protein